MFQWFYFVINKYQNATTCTYTFSIQPLNMTCLQNKCED